MVFSVLSSVKQKIKIVVATILDKIGLLPKRHCNRLRSLQTIEECTKYFQSLSLEFDSKGYFYLHEKIDEELLNRYYNAAYWENRGDKTRLLRIRDIDHFELLNKIYPDFSKSENTILNFGAGHGGISFLFHSAGHKVINFEPSGMPSYNLENFIQKNRLIDINSKVNLIYSSHSLEHVLDIKKTLKEFQRLSDKNTIFFFEVPNGNNKNIQKVVVPHTYIFMKQFFYNFFEICDFCAIYTGDHVHHYSECSDEDGYWLRFIGKGIKELGEMH